MSDFDLEMDGITTDDHTEHDDVSESSGVYADQEQATDVGKTLHSQAGDSSDEVDPRYLLRDPTLSEIRWYSRRGIGKTLVRKPMLDAFKNSFEFRGERADEAAELIDTPSYKADKDYIDAHIMAEVKSRRDGFALLFLGTDDSAGAHESPISNDVTVNDITHVDVLTVDDLSSSGVAHEQIAAGTGLDRTEYEIRDTGIVVNTDITSRNFHNPIGYILGSNPTQFIHADRVIHYVWNEEVDGDYEGDSVQRFDAESVLGEWEGDSVLISSYDLLKGIAKGNWAVMQALFRHASHMYSIELPQDANEEDMASALTVSQNINAKSALVTPDGWNVEQHESGGEMDPRSFYDVIFEQVCANHEMTKSVLFGTQSGTVSGSETDVKNYFNGVERYRTRRGEKKITQYLTAAKRMLDNRTEDDYEFEIDFDWGPLFKLDRDTRLKLFHTHSQAMSTLITNYVVEPDEARAILTAEWADIELDDLTPEQKDVLDRINLAKVGQGEWAEANDPSPNQLEEGAGRPEGARNEPDESEATPE